MNILFVHQNFPAQFKHLVQHFASLPANQVFAVCQEQAPGIRDPLYGNIAKMIYKVQRKPGRNHPYLVNVEGSVINGQAVARGLIDMKKKGFTPDLAFAHIGWGEMLYFKEVFPDTPVIGLCEFYYHSQGVDMDFDPEFPNTFDDGLRVGTRNMTQLATLTKIEAAVSPTQFQKSLYPKVFHDMISVIHEGIDTDNVKPYPEAKLTLPDGTRLSKDMEVVTYTARGLEPYRGFHIFMKAVEEICRRRPDCHILITGGDDVRYGKSLPDGVSYREKLLKEVSIDEKRVHFLGFVPYNAHVRILQVSSVHIYLTIPFVLSWSMLEAMSAQCVIVGSATAPVEEIIDNRRNGLLVDFFSPIDIADKVDEVLHDPNRMAHLGEAARQDIIAKYNVKDSISEYENLSRSVLAR